MQKAIKYIVVAVVLVAGLYCMKVEPMDGALAIAAVVAAYVLLDRLVLADSDCSCEFSPEHGIHENFEEAAGEIKSFSGSGNLYTMVADKKIAQVEPNDMIPITSAPVPVSSAPIAHTTGTDSFGKQDMGELGYSQVPVSAMANTADRTELRPRAMYGEVYVDPQAWYPPCARPPVCTTSKSCPVQPTFTNGTYIDLLEWDESRNFTAPEGINTDYITNVLNGGSVVSRPAVTTVGLARGA